MAKCPFAKWRPIAENAYQPKIQPTQIIAHSAVDAPGPTSLFGFFNNPNVTVETHFFIKFDGEIEQYLDTTVRADGNRYANVRAVSFETEDDGDPNNRRWSPAQVLSIKRLIAWLWQVHPQIQKRMCPAWNEPGVGYHSMWGAPSEWTPSRGKTCPGTIRKLQWAQEIEPWIRAYAQAKPVPASVVEEEDDMPYMLRHPSGAIWLMADGVPPTHIRKMSTVNSYLKGKIRQVDIADAEDADNILEAATTPRRVEWIVTALLEKES